MADEVASDRAAKEGNTRGNEVLLLVFGAEEALVDFGEEAL